MRAVTCTARIDALQGDTLAVFPTHSEQTMKLGRSLPVVFLGPALIVLIILAAVPTLYAFNISLQNRTLSAPDADYVWFANYIALFGDARFLNALWVSLKWEVLTVSDINELPLTLVLSWFEQKAIVILLTLFALGVKGIYTGPTAPAFLTPNLIAIIQEKFDMRSIGNVQDDLKAILAA